jgi:hypothetical protein
MTEACPEKSKGGLEEMEAVVDTFKEGMYKIEATDLGTIREAAEAAMER